VHHQKQRLPLFFFVACFIAGTFLLLGAFVFSNKRPASVAPVASVSKSASVTVPVEPVTPPAPVDNEEYWTTVAAALASFLKAATDATGGWVDALDWEERVREVKSARAVEEAAVALEQTLAKTRVPGDARSHHLAIVVAVDDALTAVRQERRDLLEAALLRIDELYNLVYKK